VAEGEQAWSDVRPRLFSAIARILVWSQLVKDQLLSMMIFGFGTDDGTALHEEVWKTVAVQQLCGVRRSLTEEAKRGSACSRIEPSKRRLSKPKECRLLESGDPS
jgi:hypothetical protein